jgi:hypothetical protein
VLHERIQKPNRILLGDIIIDGGRHEGELMAINALNMVHDFSDYPEVISTIDNTGKWNSYHTGCACADLTLALVFIAVRALAEE